MPLQIPAEAEPVSEDDGSGSKGEDEEKEGLEQFQSLFFDSGLGE